MPSGYLKNPVFTKEDYLRNKASLGLSQGSSHHRTRSCSGSRQAFWARTKQRDWLSRHSKKNDITFFALRGRHMKMRKLGILLENAISSVEKDLPTASSLVKNAPLAKHKNQSRAERKLREKNTKNNRQKWTRQCKCSSLLVIVVIS